MCHDRQKAWAQTAWHNCCCLRRHQRLAGGRRGGGYGGDYGEPGGAPCRRRSVRGPSPAGAAGYHSTRERDCCGSWMEGALPSVVAGLVSKPGIAVPTSVGGGASFGCLAARLWMVDST